MSMTQSWNSFVSLTSSDASIEQEHDLYQADEKRLFDELHGCLCCCTSCCEEEERYSVSLQRDLLRGRAYWTGDFVADYGFHVANEHPLLSCFFCHPAHPYSKLERLAVLIVVTFLTCPPTFAILRWSKNLQAKVAKEGGVGSEVLAMEQLFTRLGAQLEILLLVTVPSLVIQLILETLMILDFQLQEGIGLGRYASCCRPLCECAVRFIVTIKQSCLVFSFGMAGLVYYLSVSTLGRKTSMVDAIWPFLLSRAQSWTLWFVLDGLTPCCGFLARWCYEGKPPSCSCSCAKAGRRGADKFRAGAPLHERKDGLRKELNGALEALAKKREEAALLQWRIHHLEAELLELESMDAGIPELAGTSVPAPWGAASLDKYDPKELVAEVPRPSGWTPA